MSDYTILSRAAELAAKHNTEQTTEEGKLVEHHQWKIKQVVDALDVERAALQAKAERLQAELDATNGAISQINQRIIHDCQHDLHLLRQYLEEAPQYHDNRSGKSFPMAYGRLSLKTKTQAAGAAVIDREKLAGLYPEYAQVKTDVRWGDLKKERLTITDEGHVFDAQTGEELPAEVVAGSAKSSEEQYFVEVAGIKFDITGVGVITDDNSTTDNEGAEYSADTEADAIFG